MSIESSGIAHELNEEPKIKLHSRKNLERGTTMEYVTFSIEDVDSLHFDQEIINFIEDFYKMKGITFPSYYKQPDDEKTPNTRYALLSQRDKVQDTSARLERFVGWIRSFAHSDETEEDIIFGGGLDVVLRKVGSKIAVLPRPYVHTLTNWDNSKDNSFDRLTGILEEGFTSRSNVGESNAIPKKSKDHVFNPFYISEITDSKREGITSGDAYTIEMIPGKIAKQTENMYYTSPGTKSLNQEVHVVFSPKDKIIAVNVSLSKFATDEEKKAKIKYYRDVITGKYNIPVKFFTKEIQDGKAIMVKYSE